MTNRRKTLRNLSFPRGLFSALVLMLVGGFSSCGHTTPEGQPPLTDLTNESLAAFKEQFNNAANQTRIILLLSPT